MERLLLVTTTRVVIGIALTILLLGLAQFDWRNRRVPNRVVRPLLVGALLVVVVRVVTGQLESRDVALLVAAGAVCVTLGAMRAFGGGDMKLVIALVALFPDMRFVYLLLGATLVGLLLILTVTERRAGLRRLAALVITASQGLLPGRAEIANAYRTRGQPVTFVFSLAAIAYLWLYWVGA